MACFLDYFSLLPNFCLVFSLSCWFCQFSRAGHLVLKHLSLLSSALALQQPRCAIRGLRRSWSTDLVKQSLLELGIPEKPEKAYNGLAFKAIELSTFAFIVVKADNWYVGVKQCCP